MDALLYLIPIAITVGAGGLYAFFWALRTNQYDDPKGNAERILRDDE